MRPREEMATPRHAKHAQWELHPHLPAVVIRATVNAALLASIKINRAPQNVNHVHLGVSQVQHLSTSLFVISVVPAHIPQQLLTNA